MLELLGMFVLALLPIIWLVVALCGLHMEAYKASIGALVVADRYCYGGMESRLPIEIREGETPLRAIARHYLLTSQCTRFMEQHEMRQRKQHIADLAKAYKADGIIIEQIKFCDYWGYGRPFMHAVLQNEYGYQVLSIDRPYNAGHNPSPQKGAA